jgi:hypothetical protein
MNHYIYSLKCVSILIIIHLNTQSYAVLQLANRNIANNHTI